MDKTKGIKCIEDMKDLFIEGCANGYYKDINSIQEQAQQILSLSEVVTELNSYLDSDDHGNYDFSKLLETIDRRYRYHE